MPCAATNLLAARLRLWVPVGIGFDVADFISHDGPSGAKDVEVFAREWGIDFENHPRGGVTGIEPEVANAPREIFLMQRNGNRGG